MKMPYTFRSNYSMKISLILYEPNLVKHIRYVCEFQYIKFSPNSEISRQAAFPFQEFASFLASILQKTNNKKKAARPITPPRFSVSVCRELFGPFPDLLGLKLLYWSANGHLLNCLSRKTTQWFSGSHKDRSY